MTPSLQAFVDKVMEPLPDAVLVDTAYNSIVRRARRDTWRRALFRVKYYDSLLDAASFEEAYCPVSDQEVRLPKRNVLLKKYRAALAAALLTPAETASDIAWKRGRLKQAQYCPVEMEDVHRAIAADESFLAAHPTRRRRQQEEGRS